MPSGISTKAPEARSSLQNFDDAGNADTDTGKVDQKIHAGDVDGFLDLNLVVRKIVVDILACHIVLSSSISVEFVRI